MHLKLAQFSLALLNIFWLLQYPTHCQSQAAGLYGFIGGIPQLVVVDASNGKVTPIGKPLESELTAEQLSSIDSAHGLYYFIGFNDSDSTTSLIGLNLKDGTKSSETKLPFSAETFVGVGQTCNVDPQNGDVYVSGRDASVGMNHHILRVTPSSGKIQSLAVIGDIDVLGGASTYDAKNRILWIEFGVNTSIDIFGFNVDSGKMVAHIENPLNLETMVFDPTTNLIYGIGLKVENETSYYRTFMSLDSTTAKMNIISKIPGYFIIDSSIAALDISGRRYFCFLQPSVNESAPFNLVTVNVDQGNIVNAPIDCAINLCPWSLAYFNPSKNKM